jgi:hypothetical protein
MPNLFANRLLIMGPRSVYRTEMGVLSPLPADYDLSVGKPLPRMIGYERMHDP